MENCFFQSLINEESIPESQNIPPEIFIIDTVHETSSQGHDKVKRQGNFSVEEDLALICAWLNVSMNPLVGTDQKACTFWSKIAANFHESTSGMSKERSQKSLTHRYGTIQKAVNKFIGILTQIENSHPFGYNEHDKIQMAKSTYRRECKSDFKFDHCWNVLRNQPKWAETNGMLTRRRLSSCVPHSSSTSQNINLEEINLDSVHTPVADIERPIGTKAAKARKISLKRKGDAESPSFAEWKTAKVKLHESKIELDRERLIILREGIEMTKEEKKVKILIEQKKQESEVAKIELEEKKKKK